MDPSLIEKLKSLGMQLGAKEIRPEIKQSKLKIGEIIPGRDDITSFGKSFLVESHYPSDYNHGEIKLLADFSYESIARWAKTQPVQLDKILFLDTETSGLSGGSGTLVFMIGLGYWESNKFVIKQLFMEDPIEELGLLASLENILQYFDTLVTFNGKSFDIPILNSRFIINKFPSSLGNKQHIDALMLARRLWRNRLSDRSLGSLETNILKFSRSEDEIPGWMVPEIYSDYLRTGDPQPLYGVFYHNKIDIISLAAVFRQLALVIENPQRIADEDRLDLIAVARLFEDLHANQTASMIYEQSLSQDLPHQFSILALNRYAFIVKKEGNIELALRLWIKSANMGSVIACEELAKYYEHREKDIKQAKGWTLKGLHYLEDLIANNNISNKKTALTYRLTRLQRKLRE